MMKRLATTFGTLALTLALLALSPAGASAAPPDTLWNSCETGSGAGQCRIPGSIATDPATGHLYVVDVQNRRINEFTIWGTFVKAWGWGVRNGDPEPQTCTTQTGCQKGLGGTGDGQFGANPGLAVAVDGDGDVYVVDQSNRRVQKFDPDGGPGGAAELLLTFGGEVNKTKSDEVGTSAAERNLCTAASSDVCQAGSTGSGEGQFGGLPEISNYLAVAPNDDVYVGDAGRIQRFDDEGHYLESIALPGERVQSLVVDRSEGPNKGDLYVALCQNLCLNALSLPGSKADVQRLAPSGPAATVEATLAVAEPQGMAVDADGNVYVLEGGKDGGVGLGIRKFSPAGSVLEGVPFSKDFEGSTGIAASSACGIEGADFYVSNFSPTDSFVRAYGPAPDPAICPPPQVPPSIKAQYATSVQGSGATLKAEISPEFWPDATYQVQYGTGKCSEGGCDKEQPLAPGSKLTSQVTNRAIVTPGVFLGGLELATTYHYRFVAQSSGGGPVYGVGGEEGIDGAEGTFTTYPVFSPKTDCPNQAFRTEASAVLPDCRAYEMVSPAEKNGGDVTTGAIARAYTTPTKSSADGERLAFSSLRAFANPDAAPLTHQFLSARGPGGWSTDSISPPRSSDFLWPPGFTGQFKAFDDDLCGGWFVQDSDLALAPGAPVGVASVYRRDYCATASPYELLTPVDPPGFGLEPGDLETAFYLPVPQGFSADQAHTVIRAPGALTPEACPTAGINQVYLTSEEGPLRLVSALPNGKATCTNATAGTFEGNIDAFRESTVVGAISADGSKVFWTDSRDPDKGEAFLGLGPGDLYLRLNATEEQSPVAGGSCTEAEKACTVAIAKTGNARFWAADPQGARAIYGTEISGGEELFTYDVETAKSKSIAKVVQGVTGVSEDATRVYFISTEALSGTQENSEGDKAQAGALNLYLYEAGVGIVFVGRGFSTDVFARALGNTHTSRASPDGLHLAFASAAHLTDYDNTDVAAGLPARELYLYDAEPGGGAGELRCVSCNPSGARPRGQDLGSPGSPRWAARIPNWSEQLRPTRLLADDGSHFFFESYDDLLPRDSNGRIDVYGWLRADDAQACAKAGADLYVPSAGGCLSLISSGQSAEDSELIDVGQSGRDVFFATASSLLPQDPGLVDVYDARVGGGYPPAPKPPAICEGEACQGAASAPDDPTPASAAFKGAGNVKDSGSSSRCPKGKRKARKGNKTRCVTRKPARGAQHKRADHKRTNDERRAG
jgi:DNA-binding beta-propeller fold protein YncE